MQIKLGTLQKPIRRTQQLGRYNDLWNGISRSLQKTKFERTELVFLKELENLIKVIESKVKG